MMIMVRKMMKTTPKKGDLSVVWLVLETSALVVVAVLTVVVAVACYAAVVVE